jgi:hypothetical protein
MSKIQKTSVTISDPMDKSSKSEVNNIKERTNKLSWSNNYLNLKDRNVMLDKLSVKILSLYAISLTILFGLVGCGGPNYSRSRAEYMEQNTNKIKVNMTKQELKNIFGEPDYYVPKVPFFYDSGSLEKADNWIYLYPDEGFAHQIHFAPHTGRVIKSEKIGVGMGFL